MRNAVLIASMALLSACTTSGMAQGKLETGYLGKNADSFFVAHGPPASQYKTTDGGTIYSWASRAENIPMPVSTNCNGSVGTLSCISQPSEPMNLQCQLQILADKANTITQIKVMHDTVGYWQMSRCNEMFGAG